MKHLRLLAAFVVCIFNAFFVQNAAATPDVKAKTPRSTIPLSREWKFLKDPANQSMIPKSSSAWRNINLPHTWNDKDVEDMKSSCILLSWLGQR